MECLELNEIREWCQFRGLAIRDSWKLEPNAAPHAARLVWDPRGSSDPTTTIAACSTALGSFSDCLVWITGWGIWASSEDWPAYYSWRGKHGERRSLANAPGHLLGTTESWLLEELLGIILRHGWDAHALAGDDLVQARLQISHDGWVSAYTKELLGAPWQPIAG